VIAVDLPGHGESARQPKGVGSAPHDLAVAVGELLDELDLSTVHVAGNSSGGWVALELGRLQRARTVTALDPAGLWRKSAPRHSRVAMRQVRLTAKVTRRVAPNAPRTRLGRGLSLMQASGHPFDLPYEPVKTAVHDMAAAPGFRETLRALEKRQFEDGAAIAVPVTVAFGSRDRVLLPGVAAAATSCPTRPAGSPCPAAGTSRCSTTPKPRPTCCSAPATPPRPPPSVCPSGRNTRSSHGWEPEDVARPPCGYRELGHVMRQCRYSCTRSPRRSRA
jgi:pimeloyl-ACP methyl ester carboxylesterase